MRAAAERDWAHIKRLLFEGLLPGDIDDDAGELRDFESRYSGTTPERCWVAETSEVVVGTIALAEVVPDTAQIRWIRVAKSWQVDHVIARPLVRAAVEHACQVGFLKLIFHVPPESASEVTSFLRFLGFEFSRRTVRGGRNALEFYLNFYRKPGWAVPVESSGQPWKDGEQ